MAEASSVCPSSWPAGWLSDGRIDSLVAARARLGSLPVTQALSVYRHRLEKAQHSNEFLDLGLGHRLVDCLLALDQDRHRLTTIQALWLDHALAYLLEVEDDQPDLISLDGLDDDADIILGLLEALNRPDLARPIREHLRR